MAMQNAKYQATFDVYDANRGVMSVGSIMTRDVLVDDETGRVWEWGYVDFDGIATEEADWGQFRDERFLMVDASGYLQAHEVSYADYDEYGDKSVGKMVGKMASDFKFQLGYTG